MAEKKEPKLDDGGLIKDFAERAAALPMPEPLHPIYQKPLSTKKVKEKHGKKEKQS